MSEFKHWLDESSDADDFERAILRSGLDADPPPATVVMMPLGRTFRIRELNVSAM